VREIKVQPQRRQRVAERVVQIARDAQALVEPAAAREQLVGGRHLRVRARQLTAVAPLVIQPAVAERLLRAAERIPRDFDSLDPPDPLTSRETEILRLMAGGFSNREIAGALGTSEGTVKNHASSILSKLGVRDRTRAVSKDLDRGYI
jgi:DNA-binding NarL/FixJ family response regulator